MPRPPIGEKAMTNAERQRRYREGLKPNSPRSKARRRAERERELAARTRVASAALGARLYSVIYADPPWRLEAYSRETGLNKSADNHYPTMPLDDIKALRVPAARDCVLFMWTTAPMFPHALEIVTAWGFAYRSHAIWIKTQRGVGTQPYLGTGRWFRNAHEVLIVATRGDIPAPAPGAAGPSVFFAPRGRHSEKPDYPAAEIERLYPNLPRLEMFARRQREGWDSWGNEAPDP